MNISSLPLIGHFYLSLTLTSLIIGVIVIILFERKKKPTHKQDEDILNVKRENKNKNITHNVKADHSTEQDSKCYQTEGKEEKPILAPYGNGVSETNKSNDNLCENGNNSTDRVIINNVSEHKEGTEVTDENRAESTCSSNEEDFRKASKQERQPRKKHRCSSGVGGGKSEKTCSKKMAVSVSTILMDAGNEVLQSSLEDLAAEFRTGGLTCSVRPAGRENQWFIKKDAAHLHIFLVTASISQPHQHLQLDFTDGSPAFLYSVVCLAGTSAPDVRLSGEKLSTALSEVGGTEWLPVTDVILGERQDCSALTAQQYISKVLKKAARLSKKCCGTSCSSKKTVDIEDLVTSFLPEVMPVKT